MDTQFQQFKGKKINLPKEKEAWSAEYVYFFDGFLQVKQYNWSPNCTFLLALQTDTENCIVDITIDTVYETHYEGECSDYEVEEERDPVDDDYIYLIQIIKDLIDE